MRLHSDQLLTARFPDSTGFDPPSSTASGVSDTVWCAAPAGHYCPFTEILTTVETIGGGQVLAVHAAGNPKPTTQTVVVGRRTVKVPGGHTITLKIDLNPTGRQLLKQFGNLPVRFTIQLLRKGKLVTLFKRKLIIRPKKAHKKAPSGPKKASRAVLLRPIRLEWPAL